MGATAGQESEALEVGAGEEQDSAFGEESFRECRVCDENLNLDCFAVETRTKKGEVVQYIRPTCIKCENAIEGFCKEKKLEWGEEYKKRYAELKKQHKGKSWKTLIMAYRMANPDIGRGKKRIKPKQEFLENKRAKGSEHKKGCRAIPLTYPAWEEEAAKVQHGSLTPAQAKEKWSGWQRDVDVDKDLGMI